LLPYTKDNNEEVLGRVSEDKKNTIGRGNRDILVMFSNGTGFYFTLNYGGQNER